jgi:hypothetical protein
MQRHQTPYVLQVHLLRDPAVQLQLVLHDRIDLPAHTLELGAVRVYPQKIGNLSQVIIPEAGEDIDIECIVDDQRRFTPGRV